MYCTIHPRVLSPEACSAHSTQHPVDIVLAGCQQQLLQQQQRLRSRTAVAAAEVEAASDIAVIWLCWLLRHPSPFSMMLGSLLHRDDNTYTVKTTAPAHQRYLELARVTGVSRAFTLSVKLGLYTLLRDVKEKEGAPTRHLIWYFSLVASMSWLAPHRRRQESPAALQHQCDASAAVQKCGNPSIQLTPGCNMPAQLRQQASNMTETHAEKSFSRVIHHMYHCMLCRLHQQDLHWGSLALCRSLPPSLSLLCPAGLAGLTSQQIAARLGLKCDPGFRGVTDWLDLLVSLSNLDRTGVWVCVVGSCIGLRAFYFNPGGSGAKPFIAMLTFK